MSNLTARNSASLDFIQVFDGGCVTTRRNELIQGFISKLTHDDLLRMAEKARRAYKPVPMFKLPEGKNRWETYGEKATKLAEEVIEQERQNYVHARLDRDKNLIQAIAKSLRCLVWTVDEEGKPTKLKVVVEKVNKKNYKGDSITCDVQYVGERDTERLTQINNVRIRLFQLKEFVPYYPKEVVKLYEEVTGLATLEIVRKDEKTKG